MFVLESREANFLETAQTNLSVCFALWKCKGAETEEEFSDTWDLSQREGHPFISGRTDVSEVQEIQSWLLRRGREMQRFRAETVCCTLFRGF